MCLHPVISLLAVKEGKYLFPLPSLAEPPVISPFFVGQVTRGREREILDALSCPSLPTTRRVITHRRRRAQHAFLEIQPLPPMRAKGKRGGVEGGRAVFLPSLFDGRAAGRRFDCSKCDGFLPRS